MYIPIILGTGRSDRQSEKVAHYVHVRAESFGQFDTELIDVREYAAQFTIPPWEENAATKPWRDIAAKADGFIIVAPEYNHGYPGELKLLLDQAYEEYFDKPVALCGVSSGQFSGVRLNFALQDVWFTMKMVPAGATFFGNVKELFDEHENILDETYNTRIDDMLKRLLAYAKALKNVRDDLSK
ncbi:MAG: NADPH-dependent oxidoreductase [Candidatus Magasanikbacteria bacterium CG10_big_fil_rev_8_21_14_0_10_47_10]|uniref:NADPH-dependent oxidoreductase n=1 Tax=Candidatus Magasanikbacteria bacterium CG10_big_fil_rev_8_21_14_0_10_47_10 TaxID=1974652 RepID=A0A2H0TQH6_9BACT|nr:MAG: NADPH-dependent oxidoreductase [Candidatus Magasanikbacteria bacterium CG10_big_fil_rev_8_21_14_0_10_47_10]